MTEGICAWYGFEKNELQKYVDERSTAPRYYCNGDSQTIIVHYLQCVRLDEIKKEDVWNYGRLHAIRRWATPDRLRRIKIGDDNRIDGHQIPNISRSRHFPEIKENKFEITDGIHRIAHAREISLDCILAEVDEGIEINRSDTHLYKENTPRF